MRCCECICFRLSKSFWGFFKNVKMQILTYAGTNVSLVMYKLHIDLYLAKMRPVTSQKEEK